MNCNLIIFLQQQRLRTENRLLRQRIENLETESGELADKLIQGQVSRAQEAEDNFVIKNDLANARRREEELKHELAERNRKVDELRELNRVAASHGSKELQLIIESLQEELVAVKLREAETNDEMRGLRDRMHDLEEVNHRMRDLPPEHTVAQLQEELIAVKLREAEANLSMKELRNKISDLHNMWEEHLATSHATIGTGPTCGVLTDGNGSQPNSLEKSLSIGTASSLPTNATIASVTSSPLKTLGNAIKARSDYSAEISRLKQELMSAKLREAEAVSELKELRQKVMELETQNQVSLNQIRRQAEDMKKIRELQESLNEKQRETYKQLQEEKRRYIDLDSRCKEQQMMNRIKDLEQTQIIAELKQKLSSLDIRVSRLIFSLMHQSSNPHRFQREEIVTVKKVLESGYEPTDARELHDRMSELQSEMFRLEVSNQKLNNINHSNAGLAASNGTNPFEMPSSRAAGDSNADDPGVLLSPHKLSTSSSE